MSKQNKRRNFDSNFKAKMELEAIHEKLTLAGLASKYDVFPTQISE
jgi:transposase-like protein